MKNRKIRNSLIAAGIAVLAGVLILSVSVAIGDAPTYAPPSDAGVSPVFTGVTVDDGAGTALLTVIGVADVVVVDAEAVIAEIIIGESIASGDGGLTSGGTLLVEGIAIFGGLVSAEADLEVSGDLDVTGDITGSTLTTTGNISGNTLTIDGSISSLSSTGSLDVYGTITNSRSTKTKGLDRTQYPVEIDDDLVVTGKFGNYHNVSSNADAGWPGFNWATCPSDDVLISCGGFTSSGGLSYLNSTGNTCYATSSNGGAGVTAYARCFDASSL